MYLCFPCSGLDIEYTEVMNENVQQKILDEIENIKKNDPMLQKLVTKKTSKPVLYANPLKFKSWDRLGKWLLHIYDNLFDNFEHSVIINCYYYFFFTFKS